MMRRLLLPSTKQINKYGAYFIKGRVSVTGQERFFKNDFLCGGEDYFKKVRKCGNA